MLFKPDLNETAKTAGKAAGDRVARVASRARRRTVSIAITLLIVGGLGYIGWTALQQKQAANRAAARPDLPVPVLAATPRILDVPVYLDGVGAVRALNNVLVRAQVDGKLIAVNFTEGQDVKKGDVLGEIDPVLYKAQLDQAIAKKAQDEALLANQRLDLARYQQLAASNAGSKQQADTQRATVAQTEALVNSDQAAIDNQQAMLGYTKIIAPLSGRAGLRQVDQGNIIHASDATGLVIITQLQPIAVQFSLPQQQIVGTFSYVIGDGDIVAAKPVVVTQQNETDAVIASGLSASDRVVTTGFANLADGAKVIVGKDEQTPSADLAPRKKRSSRDGQARDGQAKDGQTKDGQGERRGKKADRVQGEGDQKAQTGPAQGSEPSGNAAKSQP
jgi:multidrug efflux pump subunit AcrA (membrane-fusion protein)